MKNLPRTSSLVFLLPLLFSCGSVQDNTDFDDPAFLAFSGRLTPLQAIATKAESGTPEAGSITGVELTESGLYALGTAGEDGSVAYRSGKYTVDGDDYVLNGVGTLRFNHSASGTVSVSFTSADGEDTQQFQADFIKPATTNKAFRTWNIDKTRITVKGWTVVSADFTGCNLAEIAEFLYNNGNKAPEEVPNRSISTLSLTGTERMILAYNDGSAELSEFSLNGNVLTYAWNARPAGFTFVTDKAVIEYMDGKCLMTIDGTIENSTTSGSVTFVLSPM